MPRTNTLHSLVQSRVAHDPDFAGALLREGIDTMLTGDMDMVPVNGELRARDIAEEPGAARDHRGEPR